jgi:hypothetical protein
MSKIASIPTRFYDIQMSSSQKNDAADQNFDYMFKLLIIGNSAVGKTSYLFRSELFTFLYSQRENFLFINLCSPGH